MKHILIAISLILMVLTGFSQNKADKICGIYKIIEKSEVSKVKISRLSNGNFEGKIIWMKEPNFKDGTPKTDIMNPDPKLRQTPADKIVLLKNFKYNEKNNEWQGEIYNPVEGKTYKAYAKFQSEKVLKVRGYVGVPALGRTIYWDKLN